MNLDERIDDLQLDGLRLIQNVKKYNFTSDAVLLANFVSAKFSDVCLEIGGGNGIISILVQHKCKPKKIVSFEIQKEAAELFNRNLELNSLQNEIEVVNSPIQDYEKFFKKHSFDVVFSNPPYLKVNEKSLKNANQEIAISRHEICLNLKDLVFYASMALKDGGKFYLVHRSERLSEIFETLKQNKLEPKRMFFTSPSEKSNLKIAIIEAVKGGKIGLEILPTLITNDLDGSYIYTIQKLYRENL